jgi:hypothetical protein
MPMQATEPYDDSMTRRVLFGCNRDRHAATGWWRQSHARVVSTDGGARLVDVADGGECDRCLEAPLGVQDNLGQQLTEQSCQPRPDNITPRSIKLGTNISWVRQHVSDLQALFAWLGVHLAIARLLLTALAAAEALIQSLVAVWAPAQHVRSGVHCAAAVHICSAANHSARENVQSCAGTGIDMH